MHYNKLVRDKVPEHLDSINELYKKRVANDEEFKNELIKKLEEEILEFKEARNSSELADIMEVIDSLKSLPEFADVEEAKKDKFERKGGFSKRYIVEGEK